MQVFAAGIQCHTGTQQSSNIAGSSHAHTGSADHLSNIDSAKLADDSHAQGAHEKSIQKQAQCTHCSPCSAGSILMLDSGSDLFEARAVHVGSNPTSLYVYSLLPALDRPPRTTSIS